jgi:hypothetical protein
MRVKMTFAVLALAALALALPASSAAHGSRVIHVSPGESIQAAIDKAKSGTTIKLDEGVYKESVNISKDDISIEGAGRRKTEIQVPAAGEPGAGCTDTSGPQPVVSGICVQPEVPDDPKARCENSPPNGPDDTVVKAVEDVEVSKLSVTGFTGIGVIYFCADDPEVTRVYAKGADHAEYGIAAFAAEDVVFARNLTVNGGEAGIYIGDSPHADATVWKNVSWNNGFGLFFRDAAHGKATDNKTFGNCLGILVLNTDESQAPPEFQSPPIDAKDWLLADNNVTANNRACPGGDEGGAISGIGIAISSGIGNRVVDNDVLGNDSTAESQGHGGIVVISEGLLAKDNTVAFNTAFGNTTDIVWDGQGTGNKFFKNDCLTSQPDGLCEDPDDNGDHEHGDDGDDRGNGHHKGDRDGDRKQGKHKSDDHKKKHKKQKKHRKHDRDD